MDFRGSFIVGFPGETDEDFEDTDDATTVIKDGSNANWEKIEVTDTEAANAAAKAKIADFFITVLPPAYFLTHS